MQDFGRFQDFSFPKSWMQILADFKILGFQNPELKI